MMPHMGGASTVRSSKCTYLMVKAAIILQGTASLILRLLLFQVSVFTHTLPDSFPYPSPAVYQRCQCQAMGYYLHRRVLSTQ